MQYRSTLRLLGLTLSLFSLSMLTPLAVCWAFHETLWLPFLTSFGLTLFTGWLLWFPNRRHHNELKRRDGFFFTAFFWIVFSLYSSLPFFLIMHEQSFTDALFECVSGFTASGGSVVDNVTLLPHSILFYRQQLQFLGGLGIVVLAVAMIPLLGVGGMQLYRSEIPGPIKEEKWTPRIMQTAKAMWLIYILLTLLCMLSYKAFGMSWFDACGESFATISTGGFGMHPGNFAYYHSNSLELVACLFMFLGGTNFSLHFIMLQKRTFTQYRHNTEFRSYVWLIVLFSALIGTTLLYHGVFAHSKQAFVETLFQVTSLLTTTGYTSSNYAHWPTYIPVLLMFLGILGGCSASTAGGVKLLRALLMLKQGKREFVTLLHPDSIQAMTIDQRPIPQGVLQSTWSFISVFIFVFIVSMLIFMALGHDLLTSFSAITSAMSNIGTGLGEISNSFAHLDDRSKWVLIVTMLIGRLEVFSLLILFTRAFWRY